MRVIMLGTGAALCDPDRNHSSILISVRGRNYLFDCGHGATHQLMRAGIDACSFFWAYYAGVGVLAFIILYLV